MTAQKGFSPIIIIIVIAIAAISFTSGIFLNNYISREKVQPKSIENSKPVEATQSAKVEKNDKEKLVYTNQKLNFAFDLKEGERVANCDENYPNSVTFIYQITIEPKPKTIEEESICWGGDVTPQDAIAINQMDVTDYLHNSRLSYIQQLEQDYTLTTNIIKISGVEAIKVSGFLKEGAPLPEFIDKVVFEYNGYLYDVDNIYLERNFRLLAVTN